MAKRLQPDVSSVFPSKAGGQGVKARRRMVLMALGWYAEDMHRGIARYAKEANWALDASWLHAFQPFQPSQTYLGDGIIWSAGVRPSLDRFMRGWRKPQVNIGYTPTPGIPRVISDPDAVMQMAFEHFHSRGFKNFAFYLHVDHLGPLAKMRAFEAVVKAANCNFHLIKFPDASKSRQFREPQTLYRRLGEVIRKLPQPLAIVAETDDPAIQALYACLEVGIRVPEQVAVLGVNDDILRCSMAAIPLSSINDNMEEIGFQAAAILDGLMAGKRAAPPLTLISPLSLTTRQSTDVLAVDNPHVAAAMAIIKNRFRERINAQGIARQIPISQRQLHSEFVGITGRTIADELTRARVEHAVRLLLATDWKVAAIARECGLGNANRLCRSFKKIHGRTPQAFRRMETGSDTIG